jgi:hypothetical protein
MSTNDLEENNLLLNEEENLLVENETDEVSLLSENENSQDTLLNDDEIKNNTPEVDEIAEANESLASMDSDPFNLMKDVNLTLTKIEKKIDKESEQLSKLDQLEEIKDELKKLNTANNKNEFNDEENTPSTGDNLPNNSDLIIQIETLQEKIQKIETTNGIYQERFKNIEETLDRFKEIEKELEIEVIEEDEKTDINEIPSKNFQPKNKFLITSLLILILLMSGAIVLDSLGIVDLYISEVFKSFF